MHPWKVTYVCCITSLFLAGALQAAPQDDTLSVVVTASTQVTNLPKDFSKHEFALLRPWEFDEPPAFTINSMPTTHALQINPLNNMPALTITDQVPPNNGLTWYYYCPGLFHYTKGVTENATVVFTGTVNADKPGGAVQCICTGNACAMDKMTAVFAMR
ncbi:MAG: hypothetical protein ACD_42C00447G0002 [uncultured bacterium]|nr:MAG: hypothetical protein ACD_42C00447G0002 [uncultured bacterium]OGT26227.1 MAG: hypothetical protein A3B71_06880 [Gammaproteobacteria bacterium RIFCSPHIGHO2_02_FULL_42_43]OGT29229.1 MAG: hypothetical protein A2624_05350 [Gammaproteobacteria bacterium RIFCSPHIGHO2_01_FULL_42_8]OGT52604.1 MAG: hypothetical protein A3E54_06480 [Gammaproteobacteria bacterium RIFCSPHIGHO2_12_FULL_41_25]OGT63202.1 MAG: hypothetical protein A3I77_06285 [Gammaproteobacteria bacterium RIFCSPLOWO2_02_FULL_42_14]OGT